jgi:hypothetical protein
MRKKLDDILQGIGSLLGCLGIILTGIAILFLEVFYEDKILPYIISHPTLLIGLAIFFFIVFISTRPNE